MHLEARRELTVSWPTGERRFRRGETLHTENSCKYTPQAFAALLRDAGFREPRCWLSQAPEFAVFWAAA